MSQRSRLEISDFQGHTLLELESDGGQLCLSLIDGPTGERIFIHLDQTEQFEIVKYLLRGD